MVKIMKNIIFVLMLLFLHVQAKDDTQVGTFDTGVSVVKNEKRLKSPIESSKAYTMDVNDSEVEDISVEAQPKELHESNTTKKQIIKTSKNSEERYLKEEVVQRENGGVILPFDKIEDNKTGVVLPMDKEKKGGFFSIFGF